MTNSCCKRAAALCCIGLLAASCASSPQNEPTASPARQDEPTPSPTHQDAPTPEPASPTPRPHAAATLAAATLTADAPPPEPPPSPTYNPQASPVAPGEVIFFRPGDPDAWVLGINVIEIWAVGLDGTDERLIARYSPATYATEASPSPDGRYLAFSDSPGAALLDLQAGEKIVIDTLDTPGQIAYFTWALDSSFLIYHKTAAQAGSTTAVTREFLRLAVPPSGDAERVLDNPLVGETPVYPARILPDNRLLLHFAHTEHGFNTAIYDPADGSIRKLIYDKSELYVWDVAPDGATLLFRKFQPLRGQSAPPAPLYRGRLTAAGDIVDVVSVFPLEGQHFFERARFLPDGRQIVALLRKPEWEYLAQVAWLQPAGSVYSLTMLTEYTADRPLNARNFDLIGGQAVLVWLQTRDDRDELWVIRFDASPGVLLTNGAFPIALDGE